MAENTEISWCDHTWSPWYGCTQVSMGDHGACVGCYARQISEIRMGRVVFGGPGRGEGTRDGRAESAWNEPLRWNRTSPGAFVFPSMCDPFDNHPDLPPLLRRFMDLIRATPHLTWLLLTKRPGNIIKLFADTLPPADDKRDHALRQAWPRNAAIGCTVVTQGEADRDIPKLLAAKAALNPLFAFVSMEPLLGSVRLRGTSADGKRCWDFLTGETGVMYPDGPDFDQGPKLDWVITGGETDQGAHKARPSHPDWFRSLRDQCAAAGVAYHHKQNGEWAAGEIVNRQRGIVPVASLCGTGWFHDEEDLATTDGHVDDEPDVYRIGKKAAGRLLDGVTHDARPELWA